MKAGETVLFHAAAGGVGQIFAQWANSIGAKVIGTVGSDDKIKVAEENGYSYVINYTKNDFSKEVLKICLRGVRMHPYGSAWIRMGPYGPWGPFPRVPGQP